MGEEKGKESIKKDNGGFKVSTLMNLVKKLGFIPYALVSLGALTEIYYARIPDAGSDSIKHFLKLLSAVLFVSGIIWGLVCLFKRLFAYRPARGLIDGLFAGLLAGFVGGHFGYGWEPMATNPAYRDGYYVQFGDPSYIRVLLAVVFTVPVGGILGLACDLIHTDRKIQWRRDLGVILLVGSVLLVLIGFGIFRYVPPMNGKGISFSNLLLLYETFLLTFCSLLAWNFHWKLRKYLGRLLLVAGLIVGVRIATGLMMTTDPAQPGVALWQKQFLVDEGDRKGEDQYVMALTVVMMCIATVAAYAVFYTKNILTTRVDKFAARLRR